MKRYNRGRGLALISPQEASSPAQTAREHQGPQSVEPMLGALQHGRLCGSQLETDAEKPGGKGSEPFLWSDVIQPIPVPIPGSSRFLPP